MRVGLVGAGFIGAVHLNAYANIPEAEVVGVADFDPEAAAAGAVLVGARPYSSYAEFVASEEVDVVDVCLPTSHHREVALAAARDGKHVILEKPIAGSVAEAEEILAAFEGDGPRLLVGHVVRYFPEYVRIKAMVESGELGEIGVARTSRRSPMLDGWNDWYADRRKSGGVLVDLLIHDFDFLRWSLGEVERVCARGTAGREYNRLDYALATLRFASGAIAHVEGHWGYPAPFCYEIEVAGSRAMVAVDSADRPSVELLGEQSGSGESLDVAVGKSPFESELSDFIRCLKTGEEPRVSGRDAVEALRVSLAAAESIETGRVVDMGRSRSGSS
ncbi:MAG: Gfo/Idh/MocA family protein [Rubrobacteraceae bacterium]|nr:Gfo/Idh/MocA family oxidoreductase [Rubrobacter sp.]